VPNSSFLSFSPDIIRLRVATCGAISFFVVYLRFFAKIICVYQKIIVILHRKIIYTNSEARFQVQPEVMLLDNKGLKPAELKLAESLVEENKEMIIERWKVFFAK